MTTPNHVTILGGGPAGLAAGHYANVASLPFKIYEASSSIGGNCRTIRFGDVLVDTGAHRLHDRDSDMTALAHRLLGDDLLHVDAPSQLIHDGRLIDFPLSPLNLLRRLPVRTIASIIGENIALRLRDVPSVDSFGSTARSTYGATLASLALLNYSRKLWGRDPDELSPTVAGQRLARLDLRTFLVESIRGRSQTRRHLDGSFYYPRLGIGQFFERLGAEFSDRILLESPVSSIIHDGGRVTAIETRGELFENGFNESHEIRVSHVVNTLPIGLTIGLLSPQPPDQVVDAASAICYRHLRLCVLVVSRERFTPNASIYFPDPGIPFTRLYESKNRSNAMGPIGATALVIEVPFESNDRVSHLDAGELSIEVITWLEKLLGLRSDEVIARHELVIPNAYPILELSVSSHVATLRRYLDSFENLSSVGRNARFEYSSIHDLFRSARLAIDNVVRDDLVAV